MQESHIQRLFFQEENALKRDCMTLNNNFCENDRFLAKEKANKTQRNFGFSDLEKNFINVFT